MSKRPFLASRTDRPVAFKPEQSAVREGRGRLLGQDEGRCNSLSLVLL